MIDEGRKVRIKELRIVGNKAYSTRKLKRIMKTSEKGFFSWLTSSGDYKEETLERDMAMLDAFYQNNGYMTVRIAEPEIETRDGWFYVTIKIDEGVRYKVGRVDVAGDLILPEAELVKPFMLPKEKIFQPGCSAGRYSRPHGSLLGSWVCLCGRLAAGQATSRRTTRGPHPSDR